MKIITHEVLDRLSLEASGSERLRKNLNLHDDYADPCQRLFIAMEPGTYVRPHRHTDPPKPECFMAVRGKLALLVFDDDGEVKQVIPFGDGCDTLAIDLPAGEWHSIIVIEPGSVFFETKPGPYVAMSDKDFAPWAPEENTAEVGSYLSVLTEIVLKNETESF
jgi:cupin fold WbuC family metalloprotein